tara:strand:- start:50 stop:214 length:165 start_codon:yes stop_codon:yes gene_type:complete
LDKDLAVTVENHIAKVNTVLCELYCSEILSPISGANAEKYVDFGEKPVEFTLKC